MVDFELRALHFVENNGGARKLRKSSKMKFCSNIDFLFPHIETCPSQLLLTSPVSTMLKIVLKRQVAEGFLDRNALDLYKKNFRLALNHDAV